MLALKSFEQIDGLSVITTDELFYVNGGSSGGCAHYGNTSQYIPASMTIVSTRDLNLGQEAKSFGNLIKFLFGK